MVAKSESWEVLRGIREFTTETCSGSTQNYSSGDTLIAHSPFNGTYKLWKYYDRKWTTTNDLRQDLLDATADTALISIITNPEFSIDHIDYDKENNMWLSCNIQFGSGIEDISCYLLRKTPLGITKYDKFYRADSNRYEKISIIANINFDNFNVPYIMCSSPISSITQYQFVYINNVLKIENDSFKLIKSVPTEKLTIDKEGIIQFDSKNNFWLANAQSLYYFADDTLNHRYSTANNSLDLPQDSNGIVNIGCFVNIFVDDSDKLTAVSNSDAIYTFANNSWALDTCASAFIRSIRLVSSMSLTAEKVQMDKKGNLWLAPEVFPYIMRRDSLGKWTYHLIPYEYFFSTTSLGGDVGQIVLLNDGKLWLLERNSNSAYYDGLIYTPTEN